MSDPMVDILMAFQKMEDRFLEFMIALSISERLIAGILL